METTAVLQRIVERIDEERMNAYGVVVRIGDDEREHRWRSDDRENLYSVSKGVAALAAGIAIDEGLIQLGTTVGSLLPALATGEGVADVTLENFLAMSSGIDFPWFADQPAPWPDLAGEMLRRAATGTGTRFQYSDTSTYVAMRMLGAVVGDVRNWLLPRLFEPLGIENPQWHRCAQGWILGGSGLYLRTREVARVGRLLRDGGQWEGHQLVSGAWIDRMHSDWVDAEPAGPYVRYGIAAWDTGGQCWRLDGRYGQYVIVSPADGAVITITAHVETDDHRLVTAVLHALSPGGGAS